MTAPAGMTFETFIEKVVGMMEKRPPKPLARAFKSVCEYEGVAIPFTPSDLGNALRAADQNTTVAVRFGRLLWSWDHVVSDVWTQETEAHSTARRGLTYDLLDLPPDLREACDARIPAAPLAGPTVIAEEHERWYPPLGLDQYYWDAYTRHLREVNKWPEESLIALDESTRSVIERLSDPSRPEAYQSKGLVVGYVQSGKTANFTGVIARAADAGYRLFIVLGGMLDILRSQTQRRIDKELVGKELLVKGEESEYEVDAEWNDFIEHGGMPSERGSFDWQRLTGFEDDYARLRKGLDALEFERFDKQAPFFARHNLRKAKARIIVIKKNPSVLERLIKDLNSLRARLADVPTLIIDDESDQASVNTIRRSTAKESKDRTATNRQITRLLQILPRAQYVGYTATPFANVFINPSDIEDVFPKDFILSLDRPAHYMGVSDFYDLGEEAPEDYRSNERAHVRSIRGSDDEPANLQRAIDSFILAGAIKLHRESLGVGRFKHHTMLVHRSPRRVVHEDDRLMVQSVLDSGGYTTKAGRDRLRALLDADVRPVSAAKAPDMEIPSFAKLEPFIGRCLAKIDSGKPVRVVNGEHRDDTPDFDRQPVWSILVGGMKLSRGYTVEGLTVSYYRRTASASDTLMQMGRWFGFRRHYKDLVRLFIGREESVTKTKRLDLYEAFRAICLDEEEFRRELQQYASMADPRITPRMVPPLVPSHLLRPTAANKMYNAKVVSENYGGRWCDKTNAPTRKSEIDLNDAAAVEMLRGVTLRRTKLDATVAGKRREFDAITGDLAPSAVLQFLEAYRWSGDNQALLSRQLEFLRGRHGNTGIRRWLLVAPQLKDSKDRWTAAGTRFDIKHRARVTAEGDRYKVYTEPPHKAVAEYLCGLCDADAVSGATAALRSETQGVLLFYPVRDEAVEKTTVSMGFALLFPRNGIRTPIRFTVHDLRNPSAVTVPRA